MRFQGISGPCFYVKITILTSRSLKMDFSIQITCKCKATFAIVTLANHMKAYRHVFTSLSSEEKETKATHSGNAFLHGLTSIMPASIAYRATQIWTWLCFEWYLSNPSSGPLCASFITSILLIRYCF